MTKTPNSTFLLSPSASPLLYLGASMTTCDANGATCLHYAAYNGHDGVIRALLGGLFFVLISVFLIRFLNYFLCYVYIYVFIVNPPQ